MIPGSTIRQSIVGLIQEGNPAWTPDESICVTDLHRYRTAHLDTLLQSERGELTALDREVIESIHANELLSVNVARSAEGRAALGGRVADRVASFGGSWPFIFLFGGIILIWITLNVVWLARSAFDPYPFILLNLVLSCLAALQAPVIMMSQNRQSERDRVRAEHDYQINLKAELEIRTLHEKIDHMTLHQWQRLMDVQGLQADLLEELAKRLEVPLVSPPPPRSP
jgi:uncharacterized membrane protein